MITVIPTLPTPPNSVTRPGTFNSDSDATFAKLPEVVTAFNANVPLLNEVVSTAGETKAAVQASASAADESADRSEAAAHSALNAPGSLATSTTELTIAVGEPNLVVQPGKALRPGMYVTCSAPGGQLMYGRILAYDTVTGDLQLFVLLVDGAGTFSQWTVAVSGPPARTLRNKLLYFAGA